ncbi:hypothetical protein [Tenggerimyces flavus]|uniref:AAA family ATPase n=1 Tax=Tenggerimyces flavus TaxID=1708749 RepID=A0ABV7Y9I3_9ACTN|nr:hypothetical protein [Tenggerimyces flavus]MBM7783774.1 broad-specificity NMP kinase [Tenggerimyces flavus]
MATILLAGGPGAGKSTVTAAVRARRLHAIDLDYGYARHETPEGHPVDFPAEPDLDWLTSHHWQWIDDRLDEAVAECRDRTGLLCGTAFNMFDRLDRFDLVLLLRLDDDTMERRLRDPRRDNPFGKTGDTVAWSRRWRRTVEAELLGRGVRAIDAREPVDRVVGDILAACAAAGYPLS